MSKTTETTHRVDSTVYVERTTDYDSGKSITILSERENGSVGPWNESRISKTETDSKGNSKTKTY